MQMTGDNRHAVLLVIFAIQNTIITVAMVTHRAEEKSTCHAPKTREKAIPNEHRVARTIAIQYMLSRFTFFRKNVARGPISNVIAARLSIVEWVMAN